MVFLPTARAAGIHHEIFFNLQVPYPTWEIHSRMSQSARGKATEAFRNAKEGVLFSSDVTARGIDVKGVTGVIQVGLPMNEEQCESFISSFGHGAGIASKTLRYPSTRSNCSSWSRGSRYSYPRRVRKALCQPTYHARTTPQNPSTHLA